MSKPADISEGVKKYLEFHDLEPKAIATFGRNLKIPKTMRKVGDAEWIAYASNKWTGKKENYIHDHSYGVHIYVPGDGYAVPAYIRECKTLVRLGNCLGYDTKPFNDHGSAVEKSHYPSLYCVPSGRALLVIEGRSKLIAMMWGGNLDVTARGIVG